MNNFYLKGDLNQIIEQKRYLLNQGVPVVHDTEIFSTSIPYLQTENEYEQAVASIYVDKVVGWWNYKDDLIKYDFCTEGEFISILREQVENRSHIRA